MRSLRCRASVSMLVLFVLLTTLPGQRKDPNIADSEPLSPRDEVKKFHVPPGFEVQLVAAEPDIHKPINIAFDDRGRLWVTETVEYPYAAPPGRKPRDAVKILADFGPDGRARNITTFADGLNIPIGVLPLPGKQPQAPSSTAFRAFTASRIPPAATRRTSAKRSTPSSGSAIRTA